MRTLPRLFLLALLASVLCAGASAASYVVEIKDMAFGPAPAHLSAGDIVFFENDDIFRHTATARNGDFDLTIAPGAQARTVIKEAGTIDVYCRLHPTMKMQLLAAQKPRGK
jgi:plastocyanin